MGCVCGGGGGVSVRMVTKMKGSQATIKRLFEIAELHQVLYQNYTERKQFGYKFIRQTQVMSLRMTIFSIQQAE